MCKTLLLHSKNHNANPEAECREKKPKHIEGSNHITSGVIYGLDELVLLTLAKCLLRTNTVDSNNSVLIAEQNYL